MAASGAATATGFAPPGGIQGFGAGAPVDALLLLSHVEAMEKSIVELNWLTTCNTTLYNTGRPFLPAEILSIIDNMRFQMSLHGPEQPGAPGTATRTTVALPRQDGLPQSQLLGTSVAKKWKIMLDCARDVPPRAKDHLTHAEWLQYSHAINACIICTDKAGLCYHYPTWNAQPTPHGAINMAVTNSSINQSVRTVRRRALFLLNIDKPRRDTMVPIPAWFARVNLYLRRTYDVQMYFSYNDGRLTGGRPSMISYLTKLSRQTRELTRSRKSNGKHPACAWRPPQFFTPALGERMRNLPANAAEQAALHANLQRCLAVLRLNARIPHYDCNLCHHVAGSVPAVRAAAGTPGIVGPDNDAVNAQVLARTAFVGNASFPQLFHLGGTHMEASGNEVRVSTR